MSVSAFTRSIVLACIEGMPEAATLISQLDYLTEKNREYMEVGCFINFSMAHEGILAHKLSEDLIVDGLRITSQQLPNGAEAILYISGGIITELELWSLSGNFPTKEITDYILERSIKKMTT